MSWLKMVNTGFIRDSSESEDESVASSPERRNSNNTPIKELATRLSPSKIRESVPRIVHSSSASTVPRPTTSTELLMSHHVISPTSKALEIKLQADHRTCKSKRPLSRTYPIMRVPEKVQATASRTFQATSHTPFRTFESEAFPITSLRRRTSSEPGRIESGIYESFSPVAACMSRTVDSTEDTTTDHDFSHVEQLSSSEQSFHTLGKVSTLLHETLNFDYGKDETNISSVTQPPLGIRFEEKSSSLLSQKSQDKDFKSPQRKSRRTSSLWSLEVATDYHEYTPQATGIDFYAVGLVAIQEALRENTRLDAELKKDEESLYWRKKRETPCPCDVYEHPSHWSFKTIVDVHNYSFLLDCKGLEINPRRVVSYNNNRTFVAFNVPMVDGHPWKVKAEQALRYTDVEAGMGDQTAFDLFYYKQPCDRKIFMWIASHKIMGLVVAEKQLSANRILVETVRYRDLEANPVQVKVGINRLWTHVSVRGQNLATTLCDLVGHFFYEGEKLRKEDFAFNDSPNDVIVFAKKYLKTSRVPLYYGKVGLKL